MRKPMRPGGSSPGYGSPGYGSPARPGAPGKQSQADRDAHSSGDFGSTRPGGGRRGPGVGKRKRQAGSGFGSEYADEAHGSQGGDGVHRAYGHHDDDDQDARDY